MACPVKLSRTELRKITCSLIPIPFTGPDLLASRGCLAILATSDGITCVEGLTTAAGRVTHRHGPAGPTVRSVGRMGKVTVTHRYGHNAVKDRCPYFIPARRISLPPISQKLSGTFADVHP